MIFSHNLYIRIKHFVGAVAYDCREFVSRNRDLLDRNLSQAMFECQHPLLKILFPEGNGLEYDNQLLKLILKFFLDSTEHFDLIFYIFVFKEILDEPHGADQQQLPHNSRFHSVHLLIISTQKIYILFGVSNQTT